MENNGDVFAYIYPHANFDGRVSEAIRANPCHVPARIQSNEDYAHRHGAREPIEPPEGEDSILDYLPHLELRFSRRPRTERGILIGSDPNCDIVISHKSISPHHLSITFDEDNRLIVKDWGSPAGTEVTYDGEGAGKRSGYQWVVGGHQLPDCTTTIIIKLHATVSFQLIAVRHDITSPVYMDKANRFRRGMATDPSVPRSHGPTAGSSGPVGLDVGLVAGEDDEEKRQAGILLNALERD
ncbi:hypothetical protein ACJZ2D_012335 [Fusarium nematophilum]